MALKEIWQKANGGRMGEVATALIFVAIVLIARICTTKEELRRMEAEEIKEIKGEQNDQF